VSPDVPVETVTEAVHRRLAAAPSMLVAATLEDALGVEERPNLPGTTSERPANWSRALPVALEDLDRHAGVRSVVQALNDGRPRSA
jgi:4-alpha-glucanotransferase